MQTVIWRKIVIQRNTTKKLKLLQDSWEAEVPAGGDREDREWQKVTVAQEHTKDLLGALDQAEIMISQIGLGSAHILVTFLCTVLPKSENA